MTDRFVNRRSTEDGARPQEEDSGSTRGRVGSGAPVSEDPSGDEEYRGRDDQDAGPIFVETPDGEHEYGR